MEFIPLDKVSKKSNKRQKVLKTKKSETKSEGKITAKKVPNKAFSKKNVRNKYKETLEQKKKIKVAKKKKKKDESEEDEDEEEEDMEVEKNESGDEEEVDVEEEEEDEEEENEDEEEEENEEGLEDERAKQEEALKKKIKEMDEKKKNRLFIKLKKIIKNEAQIKELHPDIRQVIFPRKKRSRWCWAVFVSEQKAHAALQTLIKNKEIFASKPNSYARVERKRQEKLKVVARRKEAKQKLKDIWM